MHRRWQKVAAKPVSTGDKPPQAPPPLAPESPTLKMPKAPKPGRIGKPIPPPDPLSKTAKAYKLSRRMEFRGLKISVETDKGESRHWTDPNNGEKGSTKMKYPYGYIRMTKGVDGDHVDVYVGPNEDAKNVYVVHQQKAPNFDRYDEDKCMLGLDSADEAKKAYLAHFNDDRFFGSMTVMPFEQFKKKVLGTFKRPQKIAYTLGAKLAATVVMPPLSTEAKARMDKMTGFNQPPELLHPVLQQKQQALKDFVHRNPELIAASEEYATPSGGLTAEGMNKVRASHRRLGDWIVSRGGRRPRVTEDVPIRKAKPTVALRKTPQPVRAAKATRELAKGVSRAPASPPISSMLSGRAHDVITAVRRIARK